MSVYEVKVKVYEDAAHPVTKETVMLHPVWESGGDAEIAGRLARKLGIDESRIYDWSEVVEGCVS